MTIGRLRKQGLTLLLLSSVTACGHLTQTSAPSLETAPPEVPASLARPEACDQFRVITWSGGRRDMTLQDIQNALVFMTDESQHARLDWVRQVTGDTNKTIEQIKSHNAAWRALCEAPNREKSK